MKCPQCKNLFCWICKKEISKTNPYGHFNDKNYGGKGTCKLFGDQKLESISTPPIIINEDNIPKCTGILSSGDRCNYKPKINNLCLVHDKKRKKAEANDKIREQKRNKIIVANRVK